MADAGSRNKPGADPVAAYKEMLAQILERRPSGTRQRLATALAKNRSFISQTSPIHPIRRPSRRAISRRSSRRAISPLPRSANSTRLYGEAHPKKMLNIATPRPTLSVQLPDLGDEELNRKLHGLVSGFVRQIVKLIDEGKT